MEEFKDNKVTLFQSSVSGSIGGIGFMLVGHPFDTIKVRMQAMPIPEPGKLPLYKNTYDCARKILIKEGPSGFYKGMTAPLIGISGLSAMYFFEFTFAKNLLQPDPNIPCTNAQNALAGSFVGFFTAGVMGPLERLKCLLQVQLDKSGESLVGGNKHYTGPVDVLRQLYREGGMRSIFRGTGVTFFRDVPSNAFYFGTYEFLKNALASQEDNRKGELSVGRTMLAGGMAGAADCIVGMPADVIKSILQTAPEGKYRGARDVLVELLRAGGLRELYRGLTPALLRAFPANAV